MNNWEKLIGVLCFNIWHNTSDEFEQSGDFVDMEWPFLCALYIFHQWDHSTLSKHYSIPELIPGADPGLISLKDTFIGYFPKMKEKVNQMALSRSRNSQMTIEPSKIFITLFTDDLINALNSHGILKKMNPMDFFQAGIELLLLFTMEIKEKDKSFYDLIEDIGTLEGQDANAVLDQINMVLQG